MKIYLSLIVCALFLSACSSPPQQTNCMDRGMKFCPVGSDVRCEKDDDGCMKCVCGDKKRP